MNTQEAVKQIRVEILEMVYKAKEGHIPSAFSVVEILFSIYAGMDRHDAFFLSKGHASAALYAVLAHFGYLSKEDLAEFCQYDSILGGHPHRREGIIMNSSGSLGHGFPIALGYALSKKILKEPGRIFCVVGDGETNEGTIWETAMYAEQLKLNNIACVIDNNNSQTRAMTSINLRQKFESFGWKTLEVNGHNVSEIGNALFSDNTAASQEPICIVANTVKGKGVREIEENSFVWHHKTPTSSEMEIFKKEILQ